jgi:hypothetical protein
MRSGSVCCERVARIKHRLDQLGKDAEMSKVTSAMLETKRIKEWSDRQWPISLAEAEATF